MTADALVKMEGMSSVERMHEICRQLRIELWDITFDPTSGHSRVANYNNLGQNRNQSPEGLEDSAKATGKQSHKRMS